MSARNATDAVMAVLDDAHVQTWIGDRQYDALCGRIERAIAEHAIAAKDAEIARLRDVLNSLFAAGVDDFSEWAGYSAQKKAIELARAALAGGGGVSGWMPIESAPRGVFLRTMRSSECGENIALLAKHGDEWVDRFGRTTITHSTFLAPTHWMKLTERPE